MAIGPNSEDLGPRETMDCDVVIVGAGPAGLAAAIRLRQLAAEDGSDTTVVVLEKGSQPGAHTLSGAVMDPRALTELLPQWGATGAPLTQPVTRDEVLFLSPGRCYKTPDWLVPDCFRNHGNYVISLGEVTSWMASQAESAGAEIFSGFAATEILYTDTGAVCGVATGDMGIGKDGQPTERYQRGMELRARYTIFAEGARGHLGKQLIDHYRLASGRAPQSYALGIKESWEVRPDLAQPGLVVHTAGWPMDARTYGGGFLYHLSENKVSLGFVIGLDYRNPWLSPWEEMQRWKTHPAIRKHLEGGRRLGYGARAITAGGLVSLPKLTFPGGTMVGCEAGFLNASRIKGSHAAIKTGTLAAESLHAALRAGRSHDEVTDYTQRFESCWLHAELEAGRNFKQWFKKGNLVGATMTGVEQWLLPRFGIKRPPWTLTRKTADHETLEPAETSRKIIYPKPDGVLTFDRLSSVYLSNVNHEEEQPSHLTLRDASIPVSTNLAHFAGPESRYCPAGVYEFVAEGSGHRLQINAQNCVHCKTCDIKDPTQNIVWVAPEGGGGPNYSQM